MVGITDLVKSRAVETWSSVVSPEISCSSLIQFLSKTPCRFATFEAEYFLVSIYPISRIQSPISNTVLNISIELNMANFAMQHKNTLRLESSFDA